MARPASGPDADREMLRRQVFAGALASPLDDAPSEARRDAFRAQLAETPRSLEKSGPPEHFTASAVVVDATQRRIAMTLHRKAGLWMQFGGHIEDADSSFLAAARREAAEESGLPGLVPVLPGPVGLDVHALHPNFGHCRAHWDVRFLLTVGSGSEELTASDESERVGWFPLDALPADAADDLLPLLRSLSDSGLLRSPVARG